MYTVCSMYKSCGMCTYTHVQYLIIRSLAEHTASLQRHCKVQAVSPCQWKGGTFTAAYHQRQQGLSSHIYSHSSSVSNQALILIPSQFSGHGLCTYIHVYIITHHEVTEAYKGRCTNTHNPTPPHYVHVHH